MKHRLLLIVFLALSLMMRAQEVDHYAIRDQYIVQLNGDVNAQKFFASSPAMNVKKCLSRSMNIWLIRSDTANLLSILRASPSVRVAQYNHGSIVHRQLIPNDSLFNMQWNMLNTSTPGADISATEAWQLNHSNLTRLGDTIVIAVIDGGGIDGDTTFPGLTQAGFDTQHPDLGFYINHHEIPHNGVDDDGNGYVDDYNGWNVFTNNDSVYDPDISEPHATHVSGIAGAIGNNHIGVAGVTWGVRILPVVGASNYESDVVNAYDYVLSLRKLYDQTWGAKGAFIVATNSSFGVGEFGAPVDSFPIWCAMYDTFGHYGILSAVAVPDVAVNVDQVGDVPTGCPSQWMIAVTNTTSSDVLNPQAGYGPTTVDIGAPGSDILSCFPDSSYHYLTGTSMSCPHLTGAIAGLFANACLPLLQAYYAYPDSIALLIKSYLFQSVDPLSTLTNVTTTGGRLNLYHAFLAEDAYNCNNCNYAASLAHQDLACYGDSTASVTVSAGTNSAAYHYLWSDGDTTSGLTGLQAGFYQVTITDTSGCQRQLNILIPQPTPITVGSITVIPIVSGNAGNIIINASAGNDSLTYAIDSGAYGTSAIFVVDSPGVHTIYIRSQTGCVVAEPVGIYYTGIASDGNEITDVRLYPDPVSGPAVLAISSGADMTADLMVHDLSGRAISASAIHISSGIQQQPIDLSMLSEGMYLLTLSRSGQTLASIKALVIR